jgi:hypothetical protein
LAQQFSEYCDRRHGRVTFISDTTLAPKKEFEENQALDIFNLRDSAIGDYRRYIESFLKIRDSKVKEFVTTELDKGQLWKDPLIQLNPAYKRSAKIDSLISEEILHPDCRASYLSRSSRG